MIFAIPSFLTTVNDDSVMSSSITLYDCCKVNCYLHVFLVDFTGILMRRGDKIFDMFLDECGGMDINIV